VVQKACYTVFLLNFVPSFWCG